jgi:hypothetical protein
VPMCVTTGMKSTSSRAADGVDIVIGQPAENRRVSDSLNHHNRFEKEVWSKCSCHVIYYLLNA